MKLFLRSLASFVAITGFAPFAFGQTPIYWVGDTQFAGDSPAVGDYNTANNWSTQPPTVFSTQTGTFQVPVSPDVAVFYPGVNEAGTFNITQNGTGNTLGGLLVNSNSPIGVFVIGGTVNLTNNAPLTINGTANVGGHADNDSGDVDIDGNTTLTLQGSNTVSVTNGRIVVGDNFNNFFGSASFTGTLNISSGSFSTDPTTGNKTETNIGSGTGAVGNVTQGTTTTSSTVTTGNWFYIGTGGGTGNYSLTNASILNTGTSATPIIALGVNSTVNTGNTDGTDATGLSSNGTLTVGGTSTVNIGNVTGTTADLQLGALAVGATAATGGSGTITQTGAGSNVNILGSSTMEIGDAAGSIGTYNLQAGNLNIGASPTDTAQVTLGVAAGSTGTLIQSAGTTVNALADTTFTVGGLGTGTYTMNGGTANFATALNLGANGTLNLFGGTLNIAPANLNASGAGVGNLNFGGGTLKFSPSATTTYTDNFGGNILSGLTTSTIDASASSLTSFTFANALSGSGGITLIGNGNTTFNFASAAAGPANTYTGSTGIIGGTLNASGADFAQALSTSTITIGTAAAPAILNLSLGASNLTLAQTISGTGTLNVNYNAAGETLTLNNTGNSLSTVNVTLAANTGPNASLTPGTFQLYSGTFGTISEVGAGNNVIIGDNTGTSTGTVTFGSATYTGTTTINNGFTLNATSLTSDITNAGNLNVSGAAGITGSVTNNAGNINSTGITGAVTNNGGLVNVTGATGIVGDVMNTGTINTTSLTGNVVTNSGTFSASSAMNTVTGSVMNTGTLKSSGALPSVINTPTFSIGGALTSPGTLVIRTNGSIADDFQVGGAANLNGGTIQVQILGGGKVGMTTYQIVNAASVTDTGVMLSPNTALFSYALNNTGTAEDLTVTQSAISTYATTPTQLAVAGALDGSTSPLFSLFGNIPAGASGTIPVLLDQLAPSDVQYMREIAFENSNFLVERMNGVDADLRAGYGGLDTSAVSVITPGFDSGLGRSLGSLLAYNDPAFHTSAPNGVNYYPGGSGSISDSSSGSGSSSSESSRSSSPAFDSSSQVISDTPNPYLANQHPEGPDTPRTSEFLSGDVVLAELNQNQGTANAPASKASYTAGDATAGISFRMTSHLAAGVLFDYNHTNAKTDSNGSKTDVNTYSPGLYATYFDHGFYANGLFSFGYNRYDYTHNLPALGSSANATPSGQQYVTDLDLGYDFHPDKNWVWGPTLGVTYTHLDIDSFAETGAGAADLNVDSQSVDSLRSRLGGHVIFQTNTGDVLLQPNLSLMWQHEYLDNSSGITSSFPGTSTFAIPTAAPSRDSALIGVGLTATLNNSMALYLNYLADVGAGDYWAQSVVGGFKTRF